MSGIRNATSLPRTDFTPESGNYKGLQSFRYWCQKVLPLVYDDSLSYYEILCKVINYINNMIENQKEFSDQLAELKSELEIVEKWIADFDTTYAENIIKQCIATMIFVEITDSGYIVYNIPANWSSIEFNTTGLDIELELQPNYGHLVLSY